MANTAKKNDKYFTPVKATEPLELPESFREESMLLDESELASFSLAPQRNPYLKPLIKLTLICLIIYGGWQMMEFVDQLAQTHWFLGLLASAVFIVLLLTLLKTLQTFYSHQRELKNVFQFQKKVEQIKQLKSYGDTKKLLQDLKNLYQGKPQELLLEQAIREMPDYSNDVEIINHLSQGFFSQLDQQAFRTVGRYSQQTGVLVALSPFALADILLSLWRILKMVDEISQIYGLRPSLLGRARIAKQLLNAMVLAGASELVTESIADFGTSSGAGIISARLAQGIGVGLYVSRIGMHSINLCRPVPMDEKQKPNRLKLLSSIRQYITDHAK